MYVCMYVCMYVTRSDRNKSGRIGTSRNRVGSSRVGSVRFASRFVSFRFKVRSHRIASRSGPKYDGDSNDDDDDDDDDGDDGDDDALPAHMFYWRSGLAVCRAGASYLWIWCLTSFDDVMQSCDHRAICRGSTTALFKALQSSITSSRTPICRG